MILKTIIDRLNQRIEVSNIFDRIYGLCELTGDKGWIYYIGDGQAIPVTDYDSKQGTLFWAKRGKVNISKIDSLRVSGCKQMYSTKFNLSAYAIVRKSHLPCDGEDAGDWVASRVYKLVSGRDYGFKDVIDVVSYEVIPNGYTVGDKTLPPNFEFATVVIELEVEIVSGSEDTCYDICNTGDIPLPPDFLPCTPCLTEVSVDGVTIIGNGTPSDPLIAVGGGGGGGTLLALPFTTDHLSSTGNAYAINDVVYYLGNVYRCIANNDSILPINATYWTNLGAGFPLVQQPSDWNATTGNNQILNKPTIPAAQVNSDWNAVSGVAEILNKPTIPVNLDDLADVNAPTPTNGQVLTYNNTTSDWEAATPSGPTPTGYYGAFQDNTTQTAALANTAYAVKLNTTDLTNGVSVVNDGSGNPTQITLANTGIYNIQFSLQLEKTSGSGNFTVDVWIRKNGVDVANTTGKVVLTGSANASPVVAAWNYVLDLAANDYVQLMWSTSNNNSIILAAVATPPHPGIPSAILTVTQQAGILAGTGITAINSLTGAAQSLVVGTGGTDFAVSSLGTTHTFNLPTASAANRGALSSGDWTTFNGKFNTPSGTTSQYVRGDGSLAALPFELVVAASDESTALTTGTAKITFRMPRAVTLTSVRASLTTAQASGNIFTVDINEAGTSILSTKLTIDNTEKTSSTAATPPVISDSALADDAEMTIDIDQIGNGTATGLKVTLIGTHA